MDLNMARIKGGRNKRGQHTGWTDKEKEYQVGKVNYFFMFLLSRTFPKTLVHTIVKEKSFTF